MLARRPSELEQGPSSLLKGPSNWIQDPLACPQAPLTGPHTPSIHTIAKDGRTEFLPILQDFVPYRGRCPATFEVTIKKTKKERVEQGKGTGDHLMPLGD